MWQSEVTCRPQTCWKNRNVSFQVEPFSFVDRKVMNDFCGQQEMLHILCYCLHRTSESCCSAGKERQKRGENRFQSHIKLCELRLYFNQTRVGDWKLEVGNCWVWMKCSWRASGMRRTMITGRLKRYEWIEHFQFVLGCKMMHKLFKASQPTKWLVLSCLKLN